MAIQTTYVQNLNPTVDGMIVRSLLVDTGIVEDSAGIAPGLVVSRGSGAHGVTVGGAVPLGIVGRDVSKEGPRTEANALTFARYQDCPVVRSGLLWATIADVGAPGDRLHYDSTTGALGVGEAEAAGEIDLIGYELLTTTTAGGFGLVLCQVSDPRMDRADSLRVQTQELSMDVADLVDDEVYQVFEFAAALPDEAYVIGAYLAVAEEFEGTRAATVATKIFDNAGPYDMAPGDTLVVETDNGGNETTTFDASAATVVDTTSYPCTDQNGKTSLVTIDDTHGTGEQTVTFGSEATTAAQIQPQMSAQLTGCAVTVDGTQVRITSSRAGKWSTVSCAAGTGDLTWAAPVAGTGDVNDIDVVTEDEAKTMIEADSAAELDITGITPVLSSPTSGASSELDFISGNCLALFGLSVETINGADAVVGAGTVDLGVSGGDTDALLDGAGVTSALGKINTPKGVAPSGHFGGETLALKIDANLNVNEFTTGELTAVILYHDLTGI